MGQVITFDNSRRERLRLKLLRFARAFHPVVVETNSGLHPCSHIVCHERFVELRTEQGEIELFRYDQVIDAVPMMSMEQIAAKAGFHFMEEQPKSANVLAFPRLERNAQRAGQVVYLDA
jgi:hypothetical protein